MSTQISPPTEPGLSEVDKATKAGRVFRRFVAVLLALSVVLTAAYAAISINIASQLVRRRGYLFTLRQPRLVYNIRISPSPAGKIIFN